MIIIVNAVLIPFFGAVGAAFASLLTQIFTNFILGFIWRPLAKNNDLLLTALNPAFFIHEVKAIMKELKNGE